MDALQAWRKGLARSVSHVARALALGASLGVHGCKKEPVEAPPAPLDVQLSGCRARAGSGCELVGTGPLRVFADAADLGVFGIGVAGRAKLPIQSASVRGGTRATFQVPDDVAALHVVGAGREAHISLLRVATPPWSQRAQEARRRGDLDAALAECTPYLDSSAAGERALALGIAARLALTRGAVEKAIGLFEAAIRAHASGRDAVAMADDAFALSFVLGQRSHRYAEARTLLASLPDVDIGAEGRARAAYYRGILAEETGDVREALQRLGASELAAERLGLSRLGRNARQALALLHVRLDDPVTAEQLLSRVARELEARDDVGSCESTELAINVSYMEIERASKQPEGPPLGAAREPLEGVFRNDDCRDLHLRRVAAGNLALLSYRAHQLDAARRWLELATSVEEGPVADNAEHLFQLDLAARVELEAGHPDVAVRGFDEVLRRGHAASLREVEWSALTGKAEALARRGDVHAAMATYQSAEALLDDASLAVPLGEGRAAYLDAHERSARSFCDLLVRAKRFAQAALVARRSARRAIASAEFGPRIAALEPPARARWEESMGRYRAARAALDHAAAEDWRTPLDALPTQARHRDAEERELGRALDEALWHASARRSPAADLQSPLPPGILRITWVPTPSNAVLIVERAGRASAYPLLRDDAAAPFGSWADEGGALDAADVKHIELYPTGRYGEQPLHFAKLGGRALLDWAPVSYPLLRGHGGEPSSDAQERLARAVVVVGDPTGDLPGAAREATRAEQLFRAKGWEVSRLFAAEATHDAVVDALQRVDFFYYAGHGEHRGTDGAGSRLRLAHGGSLTVGDILALPRVPAYAVFSSCDSGRTAIEARAVVGLGVAAAWLTRGADAVIAAPMPVPDLESELLMQGVVGALAAQAGELDLPVALREAQRALPSSAAAALAYRALIH